MSRIPRQVDVWVKSSNLNNPTNQTQSSSKASKKIHESKYRKKVKNQLEKQGSELQLKRMSNPGNEHEWTNCISILSNKIQNRKQVHTNEGQGRRHKLEQYLLGMTGTEGICDKIKGIGKFVRTKYNPMSYIGTALNGLSFIRHDSTQDWVELNLFYNSFISFCLPDLSLSFFSSFNSSVCLMDN